MAHHISIFIENKPGRLEKITKILQDSDINMRAISIASLGEFGVVKILVNNPDKANKQLQANNITSLMKKIIIVVVDDRPGGFHNLLKILSENKINIEDSYGFVLEDKKKAAIVIEVEKYPKSEEILSKNGFEILSDSEIYSI